MDFILKNHTEVFFHEIFSRSCCTIFSAQFATRIRMWNIHPNANNHSKLELQIKTILFPTNFHFVILKIFSKLIEILCCIWMTHLLLRFQRHFSSFHLRRPSFYFLISAVFRVLFFSSWHLPNFLEPKSGCLGSLAHGIGEELDNSKINNNRIWT